MWFLGLKFVPFLYRPSVSLVDSDIVSVPPGVHVWIKRGFHKLFKSLYILLFDFGFTLQRSCDVSKNTNYSDSNLKSLYRQLIPELISRVAVALFVLRILLINKSNTLTSRSPTTSSLHWIRPESTHQVETRCPESKEENPGHPIEPVQKEHPYPMVVTRQ